MLVVPLKAGYLTRSGIDATQRSGSDMMSRTCRWVAVGVGLHRMRQSLTPPRTQLKKNAVTFTFVADGFPIVYSGFEHGLSSGAS